MVAWLVCFFIFLNNCYNLFFIIAKWTASILLCLSIRSSLSVSLKISLFMTAFFFLWKPYLLESRRCSCPIVKKHFPKSSLFYEGIFKNSSDNSSSSKYQQGNNQKSELGKFILNSSKHPPVYCGLWCATRFLYEFLTIQTIAL